MDHDQICTYFVKKIQMSQFEMILKLSVQLVFSIQKKGLFSVVVHVICPWKKCTLWHLQLLPMLGSISSSAVDANCIPRLAKEMRVSAASMKPPEEIIMMLSLLLKNASLLMRIMENRHLQYHVMLDCKSSYVKQAFG